MAGLGVGLLEGLFEDLLKDEPGDLLEAVLAGFAATLFTGLAAGFLLETDLFALLGFLLFLLGMTFVLRLRNRDL